MKIGRKIGAALLAMMLGISCASVAVYAADGNITFTDPETAVGEMVDVKCAIRSTGGEIGEVDVTLSYDSELLRFDSGDGVKKEEDGTLSYQGPGGGTEVAFTMKFQALKEGSGKVSISSATVNSGYGGTMSMDEGDSTVTIAQGDPSKIKSEEEADAEGGKKKKKASAGGVQVTVDGTAYTLADDFADADIPAGYSKTSVTFEGEERQMVKNEAGTICLAYLRDSGDVGDFFIYNQEDATFSPYEEISISDTTTIIVLSDTSNVKLPDTYKKAGLTLNDKEFPVWHNQEQEGYYVMYAMNNSGETGYYQYDSKEGTYQRVEIAPQEKSEKNSSGLGGKLGSFLGSHSKIAVILFGAAGAVILIIIVLAVKLHNRNVELDDLYDEYGIDPEEDEPPVKEHVQGNGKKTLFGHHKDDDEDDFDNEDDDFEEEDEFEEIGINISKMNLDEDDFEEDDFEEDDFDDEDDPEDDIFSDKKLERYDTKTIRESMVIGDIDNGGDLDDLLEDLSGKKPGHQEEDDAFKVNFVDLD